MFTAVIVACQIALPTDCLTIVDNRGPYETTARCEVRVIEMVTDLSAFWMKQKLSMAYRSMECVEGEVHVGTPT